LGKPIESLDNQYHKLASDDGMVSEIFKCKYAACEYKKKKIA